MENCKTSCKFPNNESTGIISNKDSTNEEKCDAPETAQLKMEEEKNCKKEEMIVNDLTESLKIGSSKLLDASAKDKLANNGNDQSLKAYNQDCCEHNLDKKTTIFSNDTMCGIGTFRPQWLQPFASVKVYTILYTILGIIHGSYYSYLVGTLSTVEKRFAFKSKTSGYIFVADEIAPLLFGSFIGYYAGKANIPRILSYGLLISALCSFFSSFPYFVYGPVQHLTFQNIQNQKDTEFCNPDSNVQSCNIDDQPPSLPALLLLVFGSFLKGFSNIAYYVFGIIYLDDNSEKRNTPLYLALTQSLGLLGAFVGYMMSSIFLKLYENPLEDPGYSLEDPRWVGAWWIGYFLQGVILTILTIPITFFPKRLPGLKEVETPTTSSSQNVWKEIFKGLVAAMKRIGKNTIFVLLVINAIFHIFSVYGHSIMLPKYMENRFRLSASQASLFSGAVSTVIIMVSSVVGGFLIWKFKPRIKILLAAMTISQILLSIGFLILTIPQCQPANMVNFGTNDEGLILESVCNEQCDCSLTSFTPYCGQDDKVYFSPCYAGCIPESNASKAQKEFGHCSCLFTREDTQLESIITEGFCLDENCWSQSLAYLIIFLILIVIKNWFMVVPTIILLRSVHPNDKSVAYGTYESVIALFGCTLCPIIMGVLVDSACLVWQENCGETGNCWFYNMDKFSYLLHGVAAAFSFLSALCFMTMYILSKRIKNFYEDEEK